MSQRVSKKPEKILSLWGSFHLHLDNTHTNTLIHKQTHTHTPLSLGISDALYREGP